MKKLTNNILLETMALIALVLLITGCGGSELISSPLDTDLPVTSTGSPSFEEPTKPSPLTPVPSVTVQGKTPTPSQNPLQAEVNVPFTLRVNESAHLKTENMDITFKGVTEDSRCPTNLDCVWEGQATIEIYLAISGQDFDRIYLTSRAGNEDVAVKTLNSHAIRLISVEPYPQNTQPIDSGDYSATLIVSRQ